ncbi:energy-coupling factor ABC transporter ATP-binding protein, partial [Microbacterium kunmingense]|uniref:energy-coupling factor ABC transporter ATP-binding protein n=1 Tax=Microbacterium kunmingense TaxID=2915939 RepID=UPI00200552B7
MPAHPRDHAAPRTARDHAPRLLRATDVAITYEGSEAATPAAATLDVAAGEVVLLLGPSGSGKSTLTLALNGLIPQAVPAAVVGDLQVDGLDVRSTPVSTLSTRVGMVFQDPDAQLVTGTLLDEVAFGPENLRLPVSEVLGRAEAALRRVGLWDRRRENPDRLSGGGRQRLAIACALALGSPLLVLDEPTANLDPRGIDEVYAALADIVAAGDRAILLVEHTLDAAVGLVDRVVVLDAEGRLFAEGSTDDVLRTRAEELHAMGVWLPVSTLAALRLRAAGYPLDPLPLTPAELTAALDAAPGPAAPPFAASAPHPSPLAASAPHPSPLAAPSPHPSSPLAAPSPRPSSPLAAPSPRPSSPLAAPS